jgi:prepilin peptidase CpaA
MVNAGVWGLATLVAVIAGWTDWRSRRIPNWLTVPAFVVGLGFNTITAGWPGAKSSLLGAAVGLGLLLPFVAIRSLGAGDWKLMGALGAVLGPRWLLVVLLCTIFVNGIMAVVLVVWKKRVRQTLHNIWIMLTSLMTFRLPGTELTLDDPNALKVPFGVAVGITVIALAVRLAWRQL